VRAALRLRVLDDPDTAVETGTTEADLGRGAGKVGVDRRVLRRLDVEIGGEIDAPRIGDTAVLGLRQRQAASLLPRCGAEHAIALRSFVHERHRDAVRELVGVFLGGQHCTVDAPFFFRYLTTAEYPAALTVAPLGTPPE